MITENLSTLKIHKLSQKQYERELENGNIDETALYLTPDQEIDLSPYATLEDIKDKANTKHSHDMSDVIGITPIEKGGTNATTAAQARVNLDINVQMYTSLSQIGLSGAVSVATVCETLPANSILMFSNSTTGLTTYISDAPITYTDIEFHKTNGRCLVTAGATGTLNPRKFESTWHPSSGWSGWREVLTSILNSVHYGTTLPAAGTVGRIFFKKVSG